MEFTELSFSINGVTQNSPLGVESSLGDLLQLVRERYSNDSSCIASIRVDGQELSDRDEAAISLLPLSDLKNIEVTTSHPRELAEDTLQDLLVFTEHLQNLSIAAGQLFARGEHPSLDLAKLFDGIQTFAEALISTKKVMAVTQLDSLHVLEVDLHTVLQDLLNAYHETDRASLVDLLERHIPQNLTRWREHGIPSLIRSRDS